MTAEALLSELRTLGIELSFEQGQPRIRAPKGNLTPALRERIQQYKGVLPELLRQQAAPSGNPHAPFPLTELQQAYWIGRQSLDLGHVSCAGYFEFEHDSLDLTRLEVAWRKLIDRHGALRTVIDAHGMQRVLPEVPPYIIATHDLRQMPETDKANTLARAREQMSHAVLPSDRWPLFDLVAYRIEGQRTRIHLQLDLLTLDLSSIVLLFGELEKLYDDPGATLEPIQTSFRDYVTALAILEGSVEFRRAKDYWLKRVPELPPAPDLPMVSSALDVKQHRFQRRAARIEHDAWTEVRRIGESHGLTPAMVVLGAYAEILARWSGSHHFCISIPLGLRFPFHPDVSKLAGDFSILEVLEIDASAPTYLARTKAIRDRFLLDVEHRQFGGVSVVREYNRAQGNARPVSMPVVFTPSFGAGQTQQNMGPAPWSFLGKTVYAITQTPQVTLDFQAMEVEGGLNCVWDSPEGIFPPGMLDDMLERLASRLCALASPAAWTDERPLELPQAQLDARRAYNATERALPERHLHSALWDRIREQPDAPAVIDEGGALTYAELGEAALALARHLRDLGAKPGDLIATALERSAAEAVATLGILTAGAAYLPIEPSVPEARRGEILRLAGVNTVVCAAATAALSWPAGTRVIVLDQLQSSNTVVDPSRPVQRLEDLAYVIYTSGSTGVPKGVMLDHRGAQNTIADLNERFRVGQDDRVLMLSNLSFDLSVYDLFGTLGAGGAVVMPDAGRLRDPDHWTELVDAHSVTIWNSVPALMEMWADHLTGLGRRMAPSLRLVLMSGDWIPVQLPERLRRLGGARVISLGGATEASIWSIYHEVEEVPAHARSIPYGKPLANQRFYVLDEQMQFAPTWVPGQLHIGGVGVAVGYRRDPERTALSFVTHPSTGERLYVTGDFGRFLDTGEIEFLGRRDGQVKVRGFRVELGDIEAALLRHPAVKECCVIMRQWRSPTPQREARAVDNKVHHYPSMAQADRQFLVAYVVLREPRPETEFNAHLKGLLPDYMVPARFVTLPRLPMSSNGKIDRRALPNVDFIPVSGQGHVGPRNETETRVRAVWSELLGIAVDVIGVHDNFFDLGGNSMMIVKGVAVFRQRFTRPISITTLFERTTVVALGEYFEAESSDGVEAPADAAGQGADRAKRVEALRRMRGR